MTRTASLTARLALATLAAIATTAPFALFTRQPEAASPTSTPAAVAVQRSAPAVSAAQAASPPVITYAATPTNEQRKIVEWAVARFAEAGLALPSLEISFPPTCGSKAGRYFVGQAKIELCKVHRKTMLHELAHAWDDTTSIDRAGFLRERGLDHWYEQPGERSHESGGEQLALIITWGLMDVDLTHPAAEWTGQPIDEQPRLLPGLADGTPPILAALYTQLTGSSPHPIVNRAGGSPEIVTPRADRARPGTRSVVIMGGIRSSVEPRPISNARHATTNGCPTIGVRTLLICVPCIETCSVRLLHGARDPHRGGR